MKKLLLAATFTAISLGASGTGAVAQECGTVSIAEMNWASAGVMAYIDKIILSDGYGCDVEIVSGDTMPTFTSMSEKGEPDVAPELWINAVKVALDKAVADGKLIIGGEVLNEGGVEGWWVPTWLADKYNIKTVNDALARPDLFPGAEDTTKGGFFGCPSGWGCQTVNRNLFAANDMAAKGFELIDPGSAAGLDGSIAKAFARKEGWFGYYWAPTAILGKYPMTLLDREVPHNAELWQTCITVDGCENPQRTGWTKSEVFTVVTPTFAKNAAVAMGYIKGRTWDNTTAGKVLAWMSDNQASNEDGAYYFLQTFPEVWGAWVSPDVATKVKAAL